MKALAGITVALALLAMGCNRAAQPSPPAEVASAGPTGPVGVTPSAEPSAEASPTAAPTAASEAPSATPSDAPAEQGAVAVEAWYVRDGARGPWVEPELRPLAAATVGVARAAFHEVLTGDPFAPGLSTMAPAGTEILGVNRKGAVVILDVSDDVRATGMGSAAEIAFAQQLAHTATQFSGVESLRLHVEGQPVSELWGHLDWSQPVEPDEFAISPVVVTSPRHGAAVPAGRVTFKGTANTFEATIELRLINPAGDVVKETFTTATCGSGCRGDWQHAFRVPAPGRWRLVAAESDPSGGEGGGPFTTTRVFVVE